MCLLWDHVGRKNQGCWDVTDLGGGILGNYCVKEARENLSDLCHFVKEREVKHAEWKSVPLTIFIKIRFSLSLFFSDSRFSNE